MSSFKNVLVGVDLSHGDWMADAHHETPSHHACERAIQLAKAAGAELHFLAALDLDARTQRLLQESAGLESGVLDEASKALKILVTEAAEQGVTATCSVQMGKSWVAIADRAREGNHDIVVVGGHRRSGLGGYLVGSTGLHLLQSLDIPLWIVRPKENIQPKRILVATDFSPVCDTLVNLTAEIASYFQTELHLVHAVEKPGRGLLNFASFSDETVEASHQQALEEARQRLDQTKTRLATYNLAQPAQIHLRENRATDAIQELVNTHDIDVLVMGTVARRGVPGLLFGSTSQSLLHQLPCSLFTVRPAKE